MNHNNCIVDRKVLVNRRMVAWGSGETIPGTEEKYWEERECGTPLFGEQKNGVCRSCARGWKVDTNYPLDTDKNRKIVSHYFDSAVNVSD